MPHKKFDIMLLASVVLLVLIGIIMVLSASPTLGLKFGDPLYFAKRHFVYLILGCGVMYYAYHVSLERVRKAYITWFVLAVGMLALLFLPGVGQTISGATRWIHLGPLSFQPSELSKVALIIFMASYYSERRNRPFHMIRDLLIPLAAIGLILLLLLAQPDLGTAIIISVIGLSLLWTAGVPQKFILVLIVLGGVAGAGLSLAAPYRMRRWTAFLDPWKDPQGSGFHIIGSGGIWGLGLGNSRQKFFYLPQHISDFIFAISAEELGFIGATVIVLLFVIVVWRGYQLAGRFTQIFPQLLATGITTSLGVQAFVNIGVVVGLLPTTGIPLPFVSYGGSALLANLFCVGLLLNLSRQKI